MPTQIMPDGVSLSPERFVMKRMAVGGHLDIWRCGTALASQLV
jgi:hypothetical protein